MKAFKNRRQEKQLTKEELFKVKDKSKLLAKEKRSEEVLKILHVKEQDKTYYYTLGSCVFVIVLMTCLALFGGY